MALDPRLLEVLACPEDKGPLWYFEQGGFLYNPRLRRRYRVIEDVPQLLVEESEPVDEAGHAALAAQAPHGTPA